ncbi:MAG: DMT family transporter [Burkholderiaceae bacterium]|nr:DMT family transporter [Burkholderiaceae bacterium]
MHRLTRKDLVLLALLILSWGVNWPVMKLGVREFPPLTFRTLSMLGGLVVIGLAARMQRESLRVPAGQALTIVKLAVPNMLVWHALIILGVKLLSSGRAAILGYTMPVWAVLSGLAFFGDRISGRALLGVVLAMAGAALLLSSEFANISGQPLGTLFALLAAAAWGFGTVLMKRTRLDMPTISLTFWMLALTTSVMCLLSLLFERDQWRLPEAVEWAAIAYNAAIIFGFAHVVWFRLARLLPPVMSSLSVMFIPVVGTFSGAWMLGETPHWQDYTAMLLILGAMSTVLFTPKRQ